ncbi:hypothetical protein SUGI_0369580 [Cryptomeria japonica]|nr:hypothetical protein SUGI_0369580 [Cryptomeria japonica]
MAEPETQQSLSSLLCTDERDFLIRNNGDQVPVSELTGKMVGLYFSAHWCPPCRAFTPKLIQVYNELKQNGESLEIVFLSSDRNQQGFEEYYASMPWLALPFGDKVKKDLSQYFQIRGIPSLIMIGPDGKTVRKDGATIVRVHGAKAYPFTDACVAVLNKELEAAVEKYPKQTKHELHEHSLELTRRKQYMCNGCEDAGCSWSYYCQGCDFDLHPDCALKDKHSDGNENKAGEVICEGDAFRRV